MTATPAVSVLLPVHNAAATLPAAVGSVMAQTLTDWELIIVDDASTDGSAECIQPLATHDARVRVLRCRGRGIVAALQTGIESARAPLLARMDADDVSEPARLAEQCARLAAEPDLGLVSCLVLYDGDRNRNAGYAAYVDWINTLVAPDEIALNRFVESPLAHPSVVFRRELVERFGGYAHGDFPEDYELWLRWLGNGVKMAKVPHSLLKWRDLPGRLSRVDARYSPDNFFRVKAPWIARAVSASTRDRPIWVWGAGRPTRKRAANLHDHGLRIAGYIDVDPKKAGRTVSGVPVILPDALPPRDTVFVLGYVSSRGARELIRAALRQRGFEEGTDFLMCA